MDANQEKDRAKETGKELRNSSKATGVKRGSCREEKTKENGTNQEVLFIGCLWTRQAPQRIQTISEDTVNTLKHLTMLLTPHCPPSKPSEVS